MIPYIMQETMLKIDPMALVSIAALILSFFSFLVVYNKAVKNSVNKADMDEMEKDIKTDFDKQIRGVYHRIDASESINDKEHDRMRQEFSNRVTGMELKLNQIYDYLLSQKKPSR